MITKSNIFLLCIGLFSASLSSCSEGEAYSHFHHLEKGKWHRDSLLVFSIDSVITFGTAYDVTVELTTNHGYPYRNLWLLVDHNLADSLIRTDTLRCLLANEHGKWLGSGAGGLNQLSLTYRSFIPRDSVYNYRLVIRHGMDGTLLRGVEKVGIKLFESDKK